MNDFDVISEMYRRRMEDNHGLTASGEFSVLGNYKDKDDNIRYGVTVPLVSHRKQVNSAIDLCRDPVCTRCNDAEAETASSQARSVFWED